MRPLACLCPLLLLAACTTAKETPPPAEDPPAEVPRTEPPRQRSDPPAIPCRSDLDCVACSTERGCGCTLGPASGECGPVLDACFADPCMHRAASCWQGRCVLQDAAASPCSSDEQCEVRADRCQCELFAALASAPHPEKGCVGIACGPQPHPDEYRARCDPEAKRCVLEAVTEVPRFVMTLECEMHGTTITTDTVVVRSESPSITINGEQRSLSTQRLAPLWSALDHPGFATFVAETPEEGPPHPGMEKCRLSLESDALTIEDKRWMSSDELTPTAAAARQAMLAALGSLRSEKAAPVEIDFEVGELALPAEVRRDRLAKDLVLFERFAKAFPLGSAEQVLAQLDDEGEGCDRREQGYGVEARRCGLGAGYSSCSVSFASFEGEIFEATATCRSSERSWSLIEPVIVRAHATTLARRGFSRTDHLATLEYAEASVRAEAEAAVARALGPQSGAAVPPDLQEAFSRLTSARGQVVVGTYCGAAGAPPEGHRAMRALVDAGREDLLRDALRGMSPGGRLYGYVGLTLLGRNTADDDALYDTLTTLPVPIETCGGCMLGQAKASEVDLSGFEPRP